MWIDLYPEEQNERYTMLHISIHVATYYVIHRPVEYTETLNFMEIYTEFSTMFRSLHFS